MPRSALGRSGRRALPVALVLAGTSMPATAQRIEPQTPVTRIVGAPNAVSPAERVDAERRGLAPVALPEGPLRVRWRRTVGPSIEDAPLVGADGTIYVFTGRGDLAELGPDGVEQRRVAVGVGPIGPGAILSDGTVVAMTTSGEAVGIARGSVRFRTRVSDAGVSGPASRTGGVLVRIAPLGLLDGGVVVASAVGPSAAPVATEIVTLDADGGVRSRVTLPSAVAWPLVATRNGVACITSDGSVYVHTPGLAPVRRGSFGGALEGGAAALDPHTLVAVVDARRLVALDLDRADTRVLSSALHGTLLGPPSVHSGAVDVMEAEPTQVRLLTVDGAGVETTRILGVTAGPTDADGGAASARMPVHTSTLVDSVGRVAFASPDGHVGVVSGTTTTDLGEVVCGRGAPPLGGLTTAIPGRPGGPRSNTARPSAGFAGLVPVRPSALLVACESGTILEIEATSPPGSAPP